MTTIRVLLTGATGFLGSKLLADLVNRGYEVIALKRRTSDISRIRELIQWCSVAEADSPNELERVFVEHSIDVVMHCGVSYGKTQGRSLRDTVSSNVLFPVGLLECAISSGCRYFINTDSFFSQQIDAEPAKKAVDLYAPEYTMSKYYFRECGRLMAEKGQIIFINFILHHLYGEYDDRHKFIPSIIDQCHGNAESIALTDGMQRRDFIYLEDVREAYMIVLKNISTFSQGYYTYEIGTGTTYSVAEAASIIKSVLGSTAQLNFGALPRARNEIEHSCADDSMFKAFRWKARFDFETGIRKTIEKDYGNGNS